MEEVTRCSYVKCNDDHEAGQIFHELPVCNVGLCVKWLINSGHEELVGKDFEVLRSMKFFICNKHFTNNCYLTKGTLKENAVPCPYWSCVRKKKNHHQTQYIPNRYISMDIYTNHKEINNYSEKENSGTVNDNFDRDNSIKQWCRTCAKRKANLVSMTMKDKQTEMSLLSKLKLLIEIDDEDVLPLNMCRECVMKLEQSFQFFQQIYIADNTLRHIFPTVNSKYDSHNIRNKKSIKSQIKDKSWKSKISDNKLSTNCNSTLLSNGTVESQHNKFVAEPIPKTSKKYKEDKTACSLFMDMTPSNEELRWVDVLNVMKHKTKSNLKSDIYCEFCNVEFKLKHQLKNHLIISHPIHAKTMCKTCLVCYENKLLLTKHRIHFHKDKEYTCDYCQEPFLRKNKLKLHIRRLHLDEEKYLCDMCNEKLNSKEMLYEHINVNHTSQDIEFEEMKNEAPLLNLDQQNCSLSTECQRKNDVDCHCKLCTDLSVKIEKIEKIDTTDITDITDTIDIIDTIDTDMAVKHNNENITAGAISSKIKQNEQSVDSRVDVLIKEELSTQIQHCQKTEENLTCSCNGDCLCSLKNQKECIDYQCERSKMCA